MSNLITAHLKKNIQVFNLFKSSAFITKSLVLRLALGALGGLPLTSLALYTGFERLSFCFFDLVFSRKEKDPTALIKYGLLGYFFKVFADILLLAVFLHHSDSNYIVPIFISICGSLLGLGQALTQGHLEDLYQVFTLNYLKAFRFKSNIQHQTREFAYWNWSYLLNFLSILFILTLTYFLYYFYKIEYLLILTAFQNLLLAVKLFFDGRKFQHFFNTAPGKIKIQSQPFIVTTESLYLSLINSLTMLLLMSSCYFMFISICLDQEIKSELNLWIVIFMFTMGYEYFGNLFSQWLSPFTQKNYKSTLFLSSTLLLLTSLIFSRFGTNNLDFLPPFLTYLLFLLYPLLMSLGLKIIGTISLTQIHQDPISKSKDLAYSTMPGHLLLASYCFYLVYKNIGIPSFEQSFELNLYLSFIVFFLTSMYLFYQRNRDTLTTNSVNP